MAVFKGCHQTSPKVLLKWWLSLKIVIKHRPKLYWSDGCLSRLSSKAAQSSTEVMAVFQDCHQRLPKVLLKWWLSFKIVIKGCPKLYWSDGCLQRLEKRMQIFKDYRKGLEKRLQRNTANQNILVIKIVWKSVKIYSFSVWGAGIAPVDLTTLSSLRACRTLKTVVKCEFLSSPIDPFTTSDVSEVQNCGKTQISHFAERPFRHFGRVGCSKLW